MQPISVVIITKNAAHLLAATLQSVKDLTDDLVVCDTGSNDATIPVARKNGATVLEVSWRGYGLTKNIANEEAIYDWILQLDADEVVDEELLQTLLSLNLKDHKQVYTVRRKNFFQDKLIRFGHWRKDEPIRLFHREQAVWNDDIIHEKLVCEPGCVVKRLKGSILHKTVQSVEQYQQKMMQYGIKSGEQYFKAGKKGAWIKRYTSPLFSFFNHYILKLGFLDGREGLQIASTTLRYTRTKYKTLYHLQKTNKS
jgi:glycosyltransferase involved in cell wall biosynthesis